MPLPWNTLPEAVAERPGLLSAEVMTLVREEVEGAGGMGGAVLRATYQTVEKLRPGLVERAVSELSPRLAAELDPVYQDALRGRSSVEAAFEARAHEVADAIVRVADERAERTGSELLRGTYARMRGSVRSRLVRAAPRLGRLFDSGAAL
jgi:hypothetical protein